MHSILDMFTLINILALVLVCTAVIIHTAGEESFFEGVEQLNRIRSEYGTNMKLYMENSKKEIHQLLKISAKQKFLDEIGEIEYWWKKDLNRRDVVILEKYLSKMLYLSNNTVLHELKSELKDSFDASKTFWQFEAERVLRSIRNQAQNINNYYYDPEEEQEAEELVLPSAIKPLYNNQINNLTRFENLTKLLIEIKLNELQDDQVYNATDIIYITHKTYIDRFKERLRKESYRYIEGAKFATIKKLNSIWCKSNNGASQSEFNKKYKELSVIALNLIQRVNNSLSRSYILKYGMYGLFW